MVAVDDATPTLGAASACRVLGLPRASLYGILTKLLCQMLF